MESKAIVVYSETLGMADPKMKRKMVSFVGCPMDPPIIVLNSSKVWYVFPDNQGSG